MSAGLAKLLKDKSAEVDPGARIAIGFILLAIALVVALILLPLVADQVAVNKASTNITAGGKTIIGLLPLLLVVILVVAALSFLISGTKALREKYD